MAKPSINASLDALRKQSSRGIESGSSPRSAGNIMPGSNMNPGMPSAGGATAGLGANPSRVGNPMPAAGAYQPIKGSPGPMAPPTSDSVRSHSLALGGLKHMVAAGHIEAGHAKRMAAASRSHIASYRNANKATPPKTMKFGALGASGAAGMNAGSSVPGTPSLPTTQERDW